MVKGDKKNKREYERKKAQEDEAKASKRREDLEIKKEKGKSNPIPSDHGCQSKVENPPLSNFKGVKEDAAKMITEANQRFIEAREEEEQENSRWKRTITSNWTRYEIESEEENEEEAEMTGQDWDFAMSSGNRAESHTKLKGEQDWDTTGSTGLSTEFFSLDLGGLESIIKCIPLHLQIALNQKEIDPETLDMLNKTAEQNIKILESGSDRAEDLTGKLLGLLSLSQKAKNEKEEEVEIKTINTNLEKTEFVAPRLKFERPLAETVRPEAEIARPVAEAARPVAETASPVGEAAPPQQQRQRRNRIKEKETAEEVKECNLDSQVEEVSQPLEQRVRKREKKPEVMSQKSESISPKSETLNQKPESSLQKLDSASTKPVINLTSDEKADLEFLESLAEPLEPPVKEVGSAGAGVVPVQILQEEKKDLEDWLDDFLDEEV